MQSWWGASPGSLLVALLKIYILTVKYRVELGAFALNPIQESLTTEGTKQGGKS